jgi:hypothetical protein
MGFASSGACFPTQQAALDHWCANIQPGAFAQTCGGCNASASTCSITSLLTDATTATTAYPVSTPSCDVPNPVNDALIFTGAVVALWIVAWSARAVYNLFRLPHHE